MMTFIRPRLRKPVGIALGGTLYAAALVICSACRTTGSQKKTRLMTMRRTRRWGGSPRPGP
jgi:hypothetical protein